MKKVIVTQGCFLLLCSMFVANCFGDEPGVARVSNGKVTNVKRAIMETKPSAPAPIKKAGFFSAVRSKLSWGSSKNDCCTTDKNGCTKTKAKCCDKKGTCCDTKRNCAKTKGACCDTEGSPCKTQAGGCCNKNGTNCCRGNGCGQDGCNSCNGCKGLKRFFSFGKCKCGCGQRGCGCSNGHGCGHGKTLCAPFGCYSVVYPVDPFYFDRRDSKLFSAQGYGSPVSVPLAPNVRHTYNYGWGLPSSRLTPISRPAYHTQVINN